MEGILGLTYPLGINQEASKLPSSFHLVMWAAEPSDAQRQHLVQTSAVDPTALRHVQLGFFFFFPQVWRASTRTTASEPFFIPWHLVRFHSLVLSPVQQVLAGERYDGKAQEQSSSA